MACGASSSSISIPFFLLRNNEKIPCLGMGTWAANDELEVAMAVRSALEAGYRYIDTAFAYHNEEMIGKFLKSMIQSGHFKREDLFISTQLPPWGMKPQYVEKYLRKSLDGLQLNYVDLYLIQVPFGIEESPNLFTMKVNQRGIAEFDYDTDIVKIWKEMENMVDRKLTKSIGVSNFNMDQIKRILKHSKIPPCNAQIEFHILLQQKELIEFCKLNQIVVTSSTTLGMPTVPTASSEILSHPLVEKLAAKYEKTPRQIVLRYNYEKGIVSVPKCVTPEEMRENLEIFNFELVLEDVVELSNLDANQRLLNFEILFKGAKQHPEYPF